MFMFVRWGLVGNGPNESHYHKHDIPVIKMINFSNGGVLCPFASSFIRDYIKSAMVWRPVWLFDTIYPISTMSEKRRQTVDSLAQ